MEMVWEMGVEERGRWKEKERGIEIVREGIEKVRNGRIEDAKERETESLKEG